jgi:hypothetical protein
MSIKKQNCLKMGRKVALLATVCALFVACSDEDDDFFVQRVDDDEEDVSSSSKKSSTKSSSSEETDILVVATFEDLSVCTDKREGKFAYVKDERKTYVCDGDDWVIDDGAPESSSEDEETSSSSKGKSSASEDKSSSSKDKSSSSEGKSSSSSAKSSSSSVTEEASFTCGPEKKTISRGESTVWKMVKSTSMTASELMSSDFEWTFGDGATPATSSRRGSTSSDAVTYTTSGVKTASLTYVPPSGGAKTIACDPLQVNGAAITGCKCTATSETVDVAEGGTAAWTVTGCVSQGANITTYTWGGAGVNGEGSAATATLAAKGDVIQPTLVVGNDDNTLQGVTCPAVKAVDSKMPDYVLEFEGSSFPTSADVYQNIPFNQEACIHVSFDWQNEAWTPNVSVACEVQAGNGAPGLNMSINYNGKTTSFKGDYNISPYGVSLGTVKKGQNTFDDVCVTVTGAEGGTAKCYFYP